MKKSFDEISFIKSLTHESILHFFYEFLYEHLFKIVQGIMESRYVLLGEEGFFFDRTCLFANVQNLQRLALLATFS